MKRLFMVLAIAAFTLTNCKTIKVATTKLDSGVSKGIVYKLPRTQLIFEVAVKTTTYTRSSNGCYSDFKKYFKGVVSAELLSKLEAVADGKELTTSKITGVIISPMPVVDDNKIFTINNLNKAAFKHTMGVSLDDNGILNKGDLSSESLAMPLVSQLISSAAGFVSPFTSSRASLTEEPNCLQLYNQYIEVDASKRNFSTLTPFKLSNQLPSKEVYESVLAELEKQKSSLFDQLLFTTEIKEEKVILRFTPTIEDVNLVNSTCLFGFKKGSTPELHINKDLLGPISSFVSSSPGVAVKESNVATLTGSGFDLYNLTIVPLGSSKKQVDEIRTNPGKIVASSASSEGGIYYNIPLTCKIYLQKKDQNFSEATIMMPQWGALGQLPDKLTKQTFELNPLYGNLKSVSHESSGVTPDQIKTAGESLSQARDVFYTDPITKMERRIKYLETTSKLTEGEGTELTNLRKQIDLLKAQKEQLELKKAIKEFDQ